MTDADRVDRAEPTELVRLFGGAVSETTIGAVAANPRFTDRWVAAVTGRLGALPALTARQADILGFDPADLHRLAVAAGGAWNANVLVRIVDGPRRRALSERFGADFYGRALRARHLASAEAGSETDVDALATGIERDGRGCLRAWCERQPHPVGARLRLVSPSDDASRTYGEAGAGIVEWLLGDDAL